MNALLVPAHTEDDVCRRNEPLMTRTHTHAQRFETMLRTPSVNTARRSRPARGDIRNPSRTLYRNLMGRKLTGDAPGARCLSTLPALWEERGISSGELVNQPDGKPQPSSPRAYCRLLLSLWVWVPARKV